MIQCDWMHQYRKWRPDVIRGNETTADQSLLNFTMQVPENHEPFRQKGRFNQSPKQEQGVALVLSLMMGTLLIAGTSA